MIDGPTLFDALMAGSTMLFFGTTIWLRNARCLSERERNKAQAKAAQQEAQFRCDRQRTNKHICALNEARKNAIATHEAYLAAEPERQAAHLKAYFSRIAVKGNQSPKRKRG